MFQNSFSKQMGSSFASKSFNEYNFVKVSEAKQRKEENLDISQVVVNKPVIQKSLGDTQSIANNAIGNTIALGSLVTGLGLFGLMMCCTKCKSC